MPIADDLIPKPEDIPKLSFDELMSQLHYAKANAGDYAGIVDQLKEELAKRDPTRNYACFKCGHNQFELRQIRTAGGFWSSVFDVSTEKYKVVVCARCKFSEMYQGEVGASAAFFDYFLG